MKQPRRKQKPTDDGTAGAERNDHEMDVEATEDDGLYSRHLSKPESGTLMIPTSFLIAPPCLKRPTL